MLKPGSCAALMITASRSAGLWNLFRYVEWHYYCAVLVGVNEVAV